MKHLDMTMSVTGAHCSELRKELWFATAGSLPTCHHAAHSQGSINATVYHYVTDKAIPLQNSQFQFTRLQLEPWSPYS